MPLAPAWDLVKETNERVYRLRYQTEVLDNLEAQDVLNALPEGAILLCWERAGDFCHRRIVAEWFETELGIVVPEYSKKVASPQATLAGLV